MKNKKRWIIITIICILIIASIVTTVLVLNNKNQKNNSNDPSIVDDNKHIEQNENLDNKNDISQDNKENNDEKEDSILDNQENSKTVDTKKEDEKKNTNTKSNSSSRNNSTNNTSNNNQQSKPQESTPVVTETKYYALCNAISLESGKQLTESQIKAKYPVVENLKDSRTIVDELDAQLSSFNSQVGIPNSTSNALFTCEWTSTDNRKKLGTTAIVELYLHKSAITSAGYHLGDDGQLHPNSELGQSMDRYNTYLGIWNSLSYKGVSETKRIIAQYYYINGSYKWMWNPNNLHF